MTLEIILNDGKKIYPSYSPEHRIDVLKFYAEKFLAREIRNYKII